MKIKDFDTDKKVLIIAEIGNNHEGSFETALKMIEAASDAGADAVKFQTIRPELLVNISNKERFEKLKSFEFSYGQFEKLAELAHKKQIMFMSTPFDLESAKFLGSIADAIKIASSDNTFYPLISAVIETGKPVIASTGLASFEELEKMRRMFAQDFALLHCVSAYPVPEEEINLSFIGKLKELFYCEVGYSDHSLGIEAAVLSVAAGARIVEKHFTLDKNFSDFRDHQLSADPEDMAEMAKRIRAAEKMLGNGSDICECEKANIEPLRRSIVAARDLPEGHIVTEEDIIWTRPGGGLAPGEEDKVIGQKLIKPKKSHENLNLGDVE